MKQQQHLFTNKMLRALLVPIIMEQLLNALMGTVDTMMVSNVGSAAISAVSLVDSINVLIIQAFSALAAGGTIICTQYLGQKNHEMANKSARQALFIKRLFLFSSLCLDLLSAHRFLALFSEKWTRMLWRIPWCISFILCCLILLLRFMMPEHPFSVHRKTPEDRW